MIFLFNQCFDLVVKSRGVCITASGNILGSENISLKLFMTPLPGRIQRFWKEGALCISHHSWPTKKILSLRWLKKVKIKLETKVFGETFLSVFSNFLHFNESLLMKSYQLFKIYIRFYKKREKALIQQSMRKEKLRKFGLYFIKHVILWLWKWQLISFSSIGLFVHKIFFYFTSSFTTQFMFFDVGMTQEISKGEIRNDK